MVTDQLSEPYPPFDYGMSVRWRPAADVVVEGSICGFRQIDSDHSAAIVGYPKGTILALIEISSGESAEVPVDEIEPIT